MDDLEFPDSNLDKPDETDTSNGTSDSTELINVIQLKLNDLNAESAVVIKHSQVTQGRITPVQSTLQPDLTSDEALLRIVTVGDTLSFSLPWTAQPLAILIPGRPKALESEQLANELPELKPQPDVEKRSVKKPTLSSILPRLAKRAALSKNASQPIEKTSKSKRKSVVPLGKPRHILKMYSCELCPDAFTSKKSLQTHQTSKHKDFQFEKIAEQLALSGDSIDHLKNHKEESTFICETCGEQFSEKRSLKHHQRTHESVEKFLCGQCPQKFKYRYEVNRHRRTHDEQNEKISEDHSCKQCSKKFQNLHALRAHQRIHGETGPFSCEHCGKGFMTNGGLKYHAQMHAKGRAFMCELCGKQFWRNDGLVKHMRSHTGEKPYECKYCHKRFGREEYLEPHERIHTGEKPYECESCDKKFARYSGYRKHVKSHSGEKPFVCEYCSKPFARRSFLNIHIRLHTGEKPFRCEHCDKGYPQKVQLKLHMKSQHPDKAPVL